MRILMHTPALSLRGGVEMNVLQVSRELAARGHNVDLFADRDGELRDDFQSFCRSVSVYEKFTYMPLFDRRPTSLGELPYRACMVSLAALSARARRPEIIYVNRFPSLPWTLLASQGARSRVICHLHSSHTFDRRAPFLGRHVNAFIAVSTFVRDWWVAQGLASERIHVVANGVDLADYPRADTTSRRAARRQLGLPLDAFVALFLGRLVPEKGLEVLLEAWKQLGLAPDVGRLLVVGSAPSASYESRLRATAPTQGCDFLPMRRDVLTPLHAADVLVVPSIWEEPFGRVVIEAMATGCPVVASHAGGMPEIFTDRFVAMLVERGNAQALANRLRSLIGWRDEDPGLSDACTTHIRENFSLTGTVNLLEGVLEEVVKRRPARK